MRVDQAVSDVCSAELHLQIILLLLCPLVGSGSVSGLAGRLLVALQAEQLLQLLELRVKLRPGNEDKRGGEKNQRGRGEEKLHSGRRPGTDNNPGQVWVYIAADLLKLSAWKHGYTMVRVEQSGDHLYCTG